MDTNPIITGEAAAQSVQPGSNETTRCLDNFGSYVHPVAGRIFQNVGGLMFDGWKYKIFLIIVHHRFYLEKKSRELLHHNVTPAISSWSTNSSASRPFSLLQTTNAVLRPSPTQDGCSSTTKSATERTL